MDFDSTRLHCKFIMTAEVDAIKLGGILPCCGYRLDCCINYSICNSPFLLAYNEARANRLQIIMSDTAPFSLSVVGLLEELHQVTDW